MLYLKFIIGCVLICFFNLANSQIILDAGPDTTYCVNLYFSDTLLLAKNVLIEKAIEPIHCSWECKVEVTNNLIFTARDFLDDTTKLNPRFIDYVHDPFWIKFKLNITDDLGNHASDSLNVRFSSFGYWATEYHINLKIGDSIQFFGLEFIRGGIPPLSYIWEPQIGLTDPSSLSTWCKPDSSTYYYLIAMDSIGCISAPNPSYYVIVNPIGVRDLTDDDIIVLNGHYLFFKNPYHEKAIISVYSVDGQCLYRVETERDYYNLKEFSENAILLVSILLNNKKYTIKFIQNQ